MKLIIYVDYWESATGIRTAASPIFALWCQGLIDFGQTSWADGCSLVPCSVSAAAFVHQSNLASGHLAACNAVAHLWNLYWAFSACHVSLEDPATIGQVACLSCQLNAWEPNTQQSHAVYNNCDWFGIRLHRVGWSSWYSMFVWCDMVKAAISAKVLFECV